MVVAEQVAAGTAAEAGKVMALVSQVSRAAMEERTAATERQGFTVGDGAAD